MGFLHGTQAQYPAVPAWQCGGTVNATGYYQGTQGKYPSPPYGTNIPPSSGFCNSSIVPSESSSVPVGSTYDRKTVVIVFFFFCLQG
jgi:hypothetical protein